MRTPTITPYAGILCRIHGNVDITLHEYQQQMARPNSKWRCPKCGSDAEFDDDRYEELNPQED
jgi:hypothetical protein